jgi:hypothetical protein
MGRKRQFLGYCFGKENLLKEKDADLLMEITFIRSGIGQIKKRMSINKYIRHSELVSESLPLIMRS